MRPLRFALLAVAALPVVAAVLVVLVANAANTSPLRWARARVGFFLLESVVPRLPQDERRVRTAVLKIADPGVEAVLACQRGDRRLVGIGGFGLFFPGLDSNADAPLARAWAERHGYRVIGGTSDYADGPRQASFQLAAYDYARTFNQTMHSRCALKQ